MRYVGCSNMTGWQLQLAALEGRKLEKMGRYVVLQQQYNLLSRQVEWEVSPVAKRENIAFVPWSPLKGGWLSGMALLDHWPLVYFIIREDEERGQGCSRGLQSGSSDQGWSEEPVGTKLV